MSGIQSPRPAPSVGVAAVVWKEDRILLGEDHAKGDSVVYGVPGGHWESGESLIEAIRREILEEAGILVNSVRLISVYDFFRADKGKSYVTIGFEAHWQEGTLSDESDITRKNWGWYNPSSLPSPIFPPDEVLIDRCLSGLIYPGEIPTKRTS